MEIKASDYNSRAELESDIVRRFGRTVDLKDSTIVGKRDELKRLKLNDKRTVWGIRCKITDTPTESKKCLDIPNRGEIHQFGLNKGKEIIK